MPFHLLFFLVSRSAFFVLFLPSGKPAEDEVKLGSLKLKPNTKIMMMGTREESLVGERDRVGWYCYFSIDQICTG